MNIRTAKAVDLDECLRVYSAARQIMRDNGNKKQWINGYPARELLENDVKNQNLYVIEDEGKIHGVFAFILGDDPTYAYIEGGKWLNDLPYGTLHRIGSDGEVKGIFESAINFCRSQSLNVRVDTHADNIIMQHNLTKHGFTYCGVIYVEDGSPRVAYMESREQ